MTPLALLDAMRRARAEADEYRKTMPAPIPPGPERDRMVDRTMELLESDELDWAAVAAAHSQRDA